MELSTTTKVTLTETEKEMMIGTCWGAFTRANNAKIGRTLIRLLEQGTQFPNDDYKVTTLVASESRVGEATDTECREAICHFLDSIKLGKFPNLRPDWNK
jgi:hypothetical protein